MSVIDAEGKKMTQGKKRRRYLRENRGEEKEELRFSNPAYNKGTIARPSKEFTLMTSLE